MTSFCSWYTGLICLLLSAMSIAQEKKIKEEIVLGTFNYPPLMYANVDNLGRQGIGIDILKNAFSKSKKFKLIIRILPVKRSMIELERGRVDLFLGSRLDFPGLENEIIPIKLLSLKSVLFCFPKQCEMANKKDKPKKLGVIATIPGSPVNEYLTVLGNKVVPLQSLEKSFKFLLMKRASYVAAIDFSGFNLLENLRGKESKTIKRSKFTLLEIPYDLVIKKDHPHVEVITNLIKKSIKDISPKIYSDDLVKEYLNGLIKI